MTALSSGDVVEACEGVCTSDNELLGFCLAGLGACLRERHNGGEVVQAGVVETKWQGISRELTPWSW